MVWRWPESADVQTQSQALLINRFEKSAALVVVHLEAGPDHPAALLLVNDFGHFRIDPRNSPAKLSYWSRLPGSAVLADCGGDCLFRLSPARAPASRICSSVGGCAADLRSGSSSFSWSSGLTGIARRISAGLFSCGATGMAFLIVSTGIAFLISELDSGVWVLVPPRSAVLLTVFTSLGTLSFSVF